MTRKQTSSGLRPLLAGICVVMIVAGFMIYIQPAKNEVPAVDLNFDDDIPVDQSSTAKGEVEISTRVLTPDKDVIRTVDRYDTSLETFDILEPTTDTIIKYYGVGFGWSVEGTNIDWSTLRIQGDLIYDRFVGVDSNFDPIEQTYDLVVDTQIALSVLDGSIAFEDQDLEMLMPDTITVGDTNTQGETIYNQRTAEDHAMIFCFRADFVLTVNDQYGNLYDSDYSVDLELRTVWIGSSLNVEWDPQDSTTTTTTETTSETTTTDKTDPLITTTKTTDPINLDSDLTDLYSDEYIGWTDNEDLALQTGSLFATPEEQIGGSFMIIGFVGLFFVVVVMPFAFSKGR